MINLAAIVSGLLPFNEGNLTATYKTLLKTNGWGQAFPAIVKDLPSRELFNELFAFLVLDELGLPVPPAYLGLVPLSETRVVKAPVLPNGQKLVFASAEVPSPSLKMAAGLDGSPTNKKIQLCLERFVPLIAKWGQLGELYAFDSWVANVDRNLGNILFGGVSTEGTPSLWLIDHGKAFTSDNWTSMDLLPDVTYPNKLTG